MMTRRKLIPILVLLLTIFIIGPFAYWLSDRTLPHEFLYGEVLPSNPLRADEITVHWHLKFYRVCHGWVQRNIIDSRDYIWQNLGSPVQAITSPVDGNNTLDIFNTILLPKALGHGPAFYQAHITYRCNWLQGWFWPIEVDTPRLPFTIIEPAVN